MADPWGSSGLKTGIDIKFGSGLKYEKNNGKLNNMKNIKTVET